MVVLTKSRMLQIVVILTILITAFTVRTLQHTQQQKQPLVPGCDLLQGTCVASVFLGTLRLHFVGEKVIPEQDFQLELELPQGIVVESSRVEGESMYMGWIPVQWQQHAENQYQATTRVGACHTRNMVWAVRLVLRNASGQTQTHRFFFTVP